MIIIDAHDTCHMIYDIRYIIYVYNICHMMPYVILYIWYHHMACIWYGVLCCMVLNLIDILGIDSKWCREIDWCLKILRPYTYISSLDPQRCRRTAATKAHPSQSLYSDGTSNPAGRMIAFFGSFWVKLTDKDLASPYRRSLWDTCPTNLPLRQWLSVMPPPCTGHSLPGIGT